MHHALVTFCAWLELTPFSRLLQETEWVIPAVQTIHILSVAAVMGAMLMLNLRLLGLRGNSQPVAACAARYLPVLRSGLPVLLATGAVMISAEPARALQNPAFQLKMLLLVVVLGLCAAVARPLRRDEHYWTRSAGRRGLVAGLAVLCLLLWTGIVFAGRWIAYLVIH